MSEGHCEIGCAVPQSPVSLAVIPSAVCAQSLSPVWRFATPRTVARQAPLSMGFSRKGYWSGLTFPPPGDLLDPGIKPASWQAGSSPLASPRGSPQQYCPTCQLPGLAAELPVETWLYKRWIFQNTLYSVAYFSPYCFPAAITTEFKGHLRE